MTYMSSIDDPLRIAASRPSVRSARRRSYGLGLFGRVLHALMEAQRRAEDHQHVREMDERLLRDIGVSRIELLRQMEQRW
jgi:uncharacterized protein YjiS (DUF1127 family)